MGLFLRRGRPQSWHGDQRDAGSTAAILAAYAFAILALFLPIFGRSWRLVPFVF